MNIYAEKNFKCLARIFHFQETKIALARQIKFAQLEDGKYFVFRKDILLLPNVSRVRKSEKHLRKQQDFTKNVAQLLLNTDVNFLKKHQPKLIFSFQQPSHSYHNSADEFYVDNGRRTPSFIDLPPIAKRANDYADHSNGKKSSAYRNYSGY